MKLNPALDSQREPPREILFQCARPVEGKYFRIFYSAMFVYRDLQMNFYFELWNRCYSYIGRIGGPQTLSLDAGCFRCTDTGCLAGTPIHEFYHALGFYHEQSRTDRDDYVTINWSNIQAGILKQLDHHIHAR